MVKSGIIDPTMVTRSALQNAASIAKNILTTEALVVEAPEKEKAGDAGRRDARRRHGLLVRRSSSRTRRAGSRRPSVVSASIRRRQLSPPMTGDAMPCLRGVIHSAVLRARRATQVARRNVPSRERACLRGVIHRPRPAGHGASRRRSPARGMGVAAPLPKLRAPTLPQFIPPESDRPPAVAFFMRGGTHGSPASPLLPRAEQHSDHGLPPGEARLRPRRPRFHHGRDQRRGTVGSRVTSTSEAVPFLLPWVGLVVVAVALPEAGLVGDRELDSAQPLRALPEVLARHDEPQRPAVLGGERLPSACVASIAPSWSRNDAGTLAV